MASDLRRTIQMTVARFISPHAEILSIKDHDIAHGVSAVALRRHEIELRNNHHHSKINLISKKATWRERRVMYRLQDQFANVPFSYTYNLESSHREYLCMQDIDYETDYSNLDMELLQNKERFALAHIHSVNFNKAHELSWLPRVSTKYIESVLHEKWRPSWDNAQNDADFKHQFGHYISEINKSVEHIVEDMERVLRDEGSHTLIHNDLHPGNTLVYKNQDVFFIDWEEAHYGSLYLDAALRFREITQAENYRDVLNEEGLNLSEEKFKLHYTIASRYLGFRYMSWFLNTWKEDERWRDELKKYLNMALL
ncbi:aminoglycoside phosphotransferase family protein [Paenibacillus guangzhouensis]|uniref:aminoglycoside phosphotransferase family protein n=1 Tax=Paenibacillus guangzhouensis TaxID=1473112 RepID=UPI001266A3A8|nr:aminoglycoside phosphotransferase family protein [Paenibacillus guangzhouensis]